MSEAVIMAVGLVLGVVAALVARGAGDRTRGRRTTDALPGALPGSRDVVERGLGEIAAQVKKLEAQLRSLGMKLDDRFTHLLAEVQQRPAAPVVVERSLPVVRIAGGHPDDRAAVAPAARGTASQPPIAPAREPDEPVGAPPPLAPGEAQTADAAALPEWFVALWNRRDWRPASRPEARRAFVLDLRDSGWKISEPLVELYLLAYREPGGPMFLLPFLHIDATLFEPELFELPASGAAGRLVWPAEVRFRDTTTTIDQELAKLMYGACSVTDALIVRRKGVLA
ncbi:MAG TPA: hypothetical protein VFT22_25620 [Kofleriaceae bacterium]|nr:hypothetical protein [Kofleriaceae bacterium]